MKEQNPKKHFTASALIIENKKVLLLFHKKLGVWLYPGGHIEDYENPEEALFREVKEETGLKIEKRLPAICVNYVHGLVKWRNHSKPNSAFFHDFFSTNFHYLAP